MRFPTLPSGRPHPHTLTLSYHPLLLHSALTLVYGCLVIADLLVDQLNPGFQLGELLALVSQVTYVLGFDGVLIVIQALEGAQVGT